MAGAPYYRFFPGDYLRDASHLSLLEHGVYRRLIDLYMTSGGPLPFDLPRLYRLLHATSKEEQQAVQAVLEEFFRAERSQLKNKRCDAEISWQQRFYTKQSEAGKKSAEKRKTNQYDTNQRSTTVQPRFNQPEPEPEPEDKERASALPPFASQKTPVLPNAAVATLGPEVIEKSNRQVPCPAERIRELWHRCLPLNPKWEMTAVRHAKIAARWREQEPESTEDGLKWFEWFFTERIGRSQFLTGRIAGKSDRKPFRASVDFVFRSETQLLKIYEGTYA